jgi:uncharacterized membrane protein YeiH
MFEHTDRLLASLIGYAVLTLGIVVYFGWVLAGITEILSFSLVTLCACDSSLHYFHRVQAAGGQISWRNPRFTGKCVLSALAFTFVAVLIGGVFRDFYLLKRTAFASSVFTIVFFSIGFSTGFLIALITLAETRSRQTIRDVIADIDGFALGVFSVMGMELATHGQPLLGLGSYWSLLFTLIMVFMGSALSTVVGGIVRIWLMYAPPQDKAWIENNSVLLYWALGPAAGAMSYFMYVFCCGTIWLFQEILSELLGFSRPTARFVDVDADLSGGLFAFLYFVFGFGSAYIWLKARERQKRIERIAREREQALNTRQE